MKKQYAYLELFFVAALALSGCNAPESIPEEPGTETHLPTALPSTDTPAPAATETATPRPAPTATKTSPPLPTPTQTVRALEIIEWATYPYANLADPQNTDLHVEFLVRNPNEFPVRVNRDGAEVRFLNTGGEVVYTNPSPTLYLWEGSWIRGGETVPISACVCFDTSGVKKQAWTALAFVAPLEAATGVAYTTEVEVSLGEFFSLEQAHLGGDMLGAEITLKNTSDQILKSFEVRVIARDDSGKYVGVAIYSAFAQRDNSGNNVPIAPGASATGIVTSEVDYVDAPLTYQVTAIGIPTNK